MATTKIVSKQILAVAATTLLLSIGYKAAAQPLEWTNSTSFKSVRRMTLVSDTLYIATSGGVLAVSDFDLPGRTFINVDGLGTNDITDVMIDASGQMWVAGYGRLIRFAEGRSEQYLFFDTDGNLFRLNRVVDDGDNLWIAANLGLVLFSKTENGGQIQDSYQLFGGLEAAPVVYDVFLSGDSIWIATSSGLAAADRTNPVLLKSPANWMGFALSEYAGSTDVVMNVVGFDDNIYAATRSGAYRMEIDVDTSFLKVGLDGLSQLYHMKTENDSLFVYYRTSGGPRIASVVDTTADSLNVNGLPSGPVTGLGDGRDRWVAATNGIYMCSGTSGEFAEYVHTGLPGNAVTGITVSSDGVITAGFNLAGLARYVDDSWTRFDANVRGGTSRIVTDIWGNTWMGTLGNGVFLFDGDTVVHYSNENSTMIGNIDDLPFSESYVIVLGLVTDGRYLYVGCYRALNGYPIAVGDMSNLNDLSGWDSIGVDNGLSNTRVYGLDLFEGKLAVSTESNGVYICDVGNNPFGDDVTCEHFTKETSFLMSNNTRVVRYSQDGVLWVGTTVGLCRWDAGIDRFIDVDLGAEIGNYVEALTFDGRGNLWVGTRGGMAVIDAETGEVATYNTLNSEIVGDTVRCIFVDSLAGEVYIGTSTGYSLVKSIAGTPTFDITEVLAVPNPFVIDDAGDRVELNYGSAGEVRFYNAAGELVRQTIVDDPWDGKNDKGEAVASGVYIFVITDSQGNVGRGKLLLVRK